MPAKIIRRRAFRSCRETLVFLRGPNRMITFTCGLPSRHAGPHLAMGIESENNWTLVWYQARKIEETNDPLAALGSWIPS